MKKTKKTSNNSSIKQPARAKIELQREKIKRSLKQVGKKLLAPNPDKTKQFKPLKVKVNQLNHNPIFIHFLNWKGDKFLIESLIDRLIFNFDKEEDKHLATIKKQNISELDLQNLERFQKVFKDHMNETIHFRDLSEKFLMWLSNANKYIEEFKENYLNDEIVKISIKDPDGKWFESILCSNFILTFNYFGLDIIKNCPICNNFFCHKGPYARFCSEGCKDTGQTHG